MASKFSTGLRNALLVTGSFREVMDGCVLRAYAGPVPASADDGTGGAVLLCAITNDGTSTGLTFDSEATGGVVLKTPSEIWRGTNLASGTATFFRLETPGDTQGASTTLPRVQGAIALAGAELNISSTALTLGAPQAVDYFSASLPTA